MCLHLCANDDLVIPSILSYSCLQTFINELGIPMLISLDLIYCSVLYEDVIGISPFISLKTSQVEYHIIAGAHPEVKAINFSQENMEWCCGKEIIIDEITNGFAFDPGKNRVFEIFNAKSGYLLVPGTAVCLTNSMKRRKREGMNKSDSTYQRMLALNISKKEKSEYVKIWMKLMEEFKNKNLA